MARITIQKDITKRSQDEHINAPERVNLLGWMIERYVTPPECGLVVWLNGDIIANSDEQAPEEFDDAIDFEVGEIDHVIIQHRPHGTETLILVGVALLAAGATIMLAPKPSIPNNAGEQSSSPNNQLTAATNEFRPRQAIPDIAGRIRAYPDFVQPSYYTYVDNQRMFTEVMVICRNWFDIEQILTEDQPIDTIQGQSYTPFYPDSGTQSFQIVLSTNEVDGQEVIAPGDPSISGEFTEATVEEAGWIIGTGSIVDDLNIEPGDTIRLDMVYLDEDGVTINVSGSFEVVATPFNSITLDTEFIPSQPESASGSISKEDSPLTLPWFVTRGDDTEKVRFHFYMPQGIRSTNGGELTIILVCQVQEIDSNGNPINDPIGQQFTITGNTPNPVYRTFEMDGLEPSRYQARSLRVTRKQREGGLDALRIESIESARQYSADFGDVTGIILERRGTLQAVAQRQSKISVNGCIELPIFDPINGTFGSRATTRSFAQYVIYLLHTLGGVPLSQIDYEALFDIEDSLSSEELGYFDFSFDDADVSLRERVITACNAARVRVFYVGATWNFVREEPRANRVALFSRRNIAPNSSSQTFRFQRDGDPDGVTIKWVDPDTNAEAYEYRRWDGSQVLNEQALRPIEESLAGCRNQVQAANRADWEMNKLINQRRRVTDTIIKDALYVGLGERVGWVDINDADLFDGEIMGISGSDYDTSERFTPESGVDYYVYITDDEGNTSATVQAYPRTDTEFGFSAPGLSGAYVATGIQQLGSRYFIASQNELDAADFIVVSKGRPDEQGRVQVELAEVIEE